MTRTTTRPCVGRSGLLAVLAGVGCLVAPALAVLVAAPGVAAPVVAQDELGISTDGRTWSSTLDRALFDPRMRWVPGDSETATFYVRNQGPSSAELLIAVQRSSSVLLDRDDVVLSARASGGAWQRLEEGAAAARLLEGRVDRRQAVRVDVNVRFRASSPNRSESRVLPLTFEVTLLDARAGGPGDGGPDEPGGPGAAGSGPAADGSLLPDTGSPVSLGWIGAALLMVVGGIAVLAKKEKADGRTT